MEAKINVDSKNKIRNSIYSKTALPPCAKFKCDYFEKCKNELLACSAFSRYAESGYAERPSKPPTKEKFLKTFRCNE